MGGGDLVNNLVYISWFELEINCSFFNSQNLKKSWHPSTLRNIERVWKAEQKHEAEQKKIEQLQRELADERARDEIRHYAEEKGVVKLV